MEGFISIRSLHISQGRGGGLVPRPHYWQAPPPKKATRADMVRKDKGMLRPCLARPNYCHDPNLSYCPNIASSGNAQQTLNSTRRVQQIIACFQSMPPPPCCSVSVDPCSHLLCHRHPHPQLSRKNSSLSASVPTS